MSTERDVPDGATEPTARPNLTPPPRPMSPRPSGTRQDASGTRRNAATIITVAFFAVLLLAALAVFVVLPDWVRDQQQPGSELTAVPPIESSALEPVGPETPIDDPDGESMAKAARLEMPEPPPRVPERPALPPPDAEPARPPAPPAEGVAAPRPKAQRVVDDPAADGDFKRAMSEGLTALDREDHATAREAFSRAAALKPGSTQSADGLARTEAGARLAAIQTLREQALAFETQEDWHAAAKRYDAALELDPAVEFALDGGARSRRRAELTDRLDFHLANPGRLSSDEVLQEASATLEQASEVETAGPKLQHQKDKLAEAIAAFSTPVTATLESDQLTQVVVYKVGRLGTFSRRALDLRPGTYTVVGSRQGYRDIRRQLVIEPGVEPRPLAIRCEERI